jgi:hypothetical protein
LAPLGKRDHGLLALQQRRAFQRRGADDAHARQQRAEERRVVHEVLDQRPRLSSAALDDARGSASAIIMPVVGEERPGMVPDQQSRPESGTCSSPAVSTRHQRS